MSLERFAQLEVHAEMATPARSPCVNKARLGRGDAAHVPNRSLGTETLSL